MIHPLRTCLCSGALVAAVALPSVALAQGAEGGKLPPRVKQRVHRIDIALNKAIDAIDDGDNATAILKLSAVEKHIARAQKAALRQVDGDRGPAAVGAVARAEDEVATATADALDGAGDELSAALASTLGVALDGRDALVTAMETDPEAYSHVADRVSEDSGDEAEAFAEGLEDDDLTTAGETALTEGAAQATATSTAAAAIAGTSADESDEESDEEGEDCPEGGPRGGGHHGGHGPGGGPGQGGPMGSEDDSQVPPSPGV